MDLSKLHPELLSSWDFKKNPNFDIHNVKAKDKVWWICKKWHEYEATIDSRTRWVLCSYCSNRAVLQWYNDLTTTNPELAKQWNYKKNNIKPTEVTQNSGKKVRRKCEKWHEREASIDNRSKWRWCPYCGNKIILKWYNDLATTHPELVEEWDFEKNKNIQPTEVTFWSNQKIWWKCKKCGNIWNASINTRSQWYWCQECWNRKISSKLKENALSRLWSIKDSHPELVEEWDFEKNKNINIEEVTSWSSIKAWWKCKKCNYRWETLVYLRCKWSWCPKCAGQIKTDKEFKEEIKKTNPNIIVLWTYKSAKNKILCECKICWNRWEMKCNNLQQWQWCPNCANIKRWENQSLWQENFELRMKKVNSNIQILWKYKTAHDRVKVMCLNCGHRRNPLAWDILRWTWCPNCCHTSTSYIEKFIFYAFASNIGENNLISRDKKTIGKELDIYIPKYNFAVEPWSRFWHKDKLNEDLRKRKMCEKKWIKLVIIYDSCKNQATYENLRKNDIMFFKEDLWNIKSKETLKWLVLKLFEMIDLPCLINEKQWDDISNKAYLASRQRNTEEFISDLKSKNDKVTVIWEYLWFKKKINVKCNKCWYEWFAQAWHLLNWKACPKCAWVILKTNDQFIQDLKEKQPNIISLEKYINTKTNIKVKCLICNHEWKARPANLLHWYWCPNCAHKKIWKSNCKKVSQYSFDWKFIKEFESVAEAWRKTWIWKTSIWNALSWRSKMAWWYIWKYEE